MSNSEEKEEQRRSCSDSWELENVLYLKIFSLIPVQNMEELSAIRTQAEAGGEVLLFPLTQAVN